MTAPSLPRTTLFPHIKITHITHVDINIGDIKESMSASTQSACLDARPFIAVDGALEFLHVNWNDGATSYSNVFYSEIHQTVLDNPDLLFDVNNDDPNGVSSGTCHIGYRYCHFHLRGFPCSRTTCSASLFFHWNFPNFFLHSFSANARTRWFNSQRSVLTSTDFRGDLNTANWVFGGAGNSMWTTTARPGATYSSHAFSSCTGHGVPYVNWGFRGKQEYSTRKYQFVTVDM